MTHLFTFRTRLGASKTYETLCGLSSREAGLSRAAASREVAFGPRGPVTCEGCKAAREASAARVERAVAAFLFPTPATRCLIGRNGFTPARIAAGEVRAEGRMYGDRA